MIIEFRLASPKWGNCALENPVNFIRVMWLQSGPQALFWVTLCNCHISFKIERNFPIQVYTCFVMTENSTILKRTLHPGVDTFFPLWKEAAEDLEPGNFGCSLSCFWHLWNLTNRFPSQGHRVPLPVNEEFTFLISRVLQLISKNTPILCYTNKIVYERKISQYRQPKEEGREGGVTGRER